VSGPVPKGGSNDLGADQGGDTFNYLAIPAITGALAYAGPGTTGNSILPTCTGLFHQGCSFPNNMLGRNSSIGPNVWNWNLGVFKHFPVTEKVDLELRGEFYDVVNHKNFYVLGYLLGGADVSSLPTNAAGQPMITAMKGGFGNPFDERRVTQVAVRVTF
jgi:hypothetical protein